MGNRIRSERLCLRQLDTDEARALLQGKADPARPWMAGYPMQGTLIAVEAFVRAVDNGADPGAYGVYQLVRSGDDVVVGDIGFHGPPSPAGLGGPWNPISPMTTASLDRTSWYTP